MPKSFHEISLWSTRVAGAICVFMLISGRSWGNTMLLLIEIFFIIIWAEAEYSEYKSGRPR